jgi:hypothetical protein
MSWLRNEFTRQHWLYLVWLVWFSAFVLLARATLGGPDGVRYMAYLRSLVFDHDLLLFNELMHFGQRLIITATGYSAQIANVGVLPFWLPFYLLGVASAGLSGDMGNGLTSDYQLWLDFGDWVYGLLAMGVMYRWTRRHFSARTALTATLLIGLGTPFVYYMTALAPSYHTISTLLAALYLYLWDTTRAQRTRWHWLGLGLLLGFLVSMGQYHILFGVFLIFDFRFLIEATNNQKSKIKNTKWVFIPLLLLMGILLPLMSQFITWGIIFGNPFANPYTLEADWSGAHVFDVWFSSYHGLYFTAPILLLATLGWLLVIGHWLLVTNNQLPTTNNQLPISLGAFAILFGIAYSSATRIGWWGGVSFGARYFISLTPLFVMGFAFLLDIQSSKFKVQHPTSNIQLPVTTYPFLLIIGIACALWTYGYYLQASNGLTSFSEYHSASQWLYGQWLVLQHLDELIAQHWLTPRSPALISNLATFALVSLLIMRLTAHFKVSTVKAFSIGLSLIPIGFSLLLLSTIPTNDAHRQTLSAQGFYEKNRARSQLDFESFSGEYVERARYHQLVGQPDRARAMLERALALWLVPSRQLVSEAERADYRPLEFRFGDDIQLVGLNVNEQPANGIPAITCPSPHAPCALRLRLLWQVTTRPAYDYDVGVLLLDSRGQILTRTPPTQGLDPFPVNWWLPNMHIGDTHTFDLSTLNLPAPSLIKIKIELFDARANKRLPITDSTGKRHDGIIGEVRQPALVTTAAPPPVATFGHPPQISLLHYRLTANELTLMWRAETSPTNDYTVFVHWLDVHNRILAQSDTQPRGGAYPTHAWDIGEIVTDTYPINLAPNVRAQVTQIAVGLYTVADGARLPNRAGGDAIILRDVKP